ncbi:MAG: efflux RND transporter permease subunit, partial [Myxococcales bacterium]|nr:efflux RND transporter permease subunit [Myxococcales bacterium]
SRGGAELSVGFHWGDDMIARQLQIDAAIAATAKGLPPETTYEVRRMEPTVFPVLGYTLTSDTVPAVQLRDLALFQIRTALASVPGIAEIRVLGGEEAEYQVLIAADRLNARQLTAADVAHAITASHVLGAVGRSEDFGQLYLLMAANALESAAQIEDVVVASNALGVVRVRDVAQVVPATAPRWTRVAADGHDAVIFQIYQQPEGNTVQISSDVRAILAAMAKELPAGVAIHDWYDQSDLIVSSATAVRDAIGIGILLAGLVLFLFLRDLKVTAIAAAAVAAVLAITVLALRAMGMSFNVMTLGGVAAAVGLIIDDAIVVVEHIARRREADATLSVAEAAAEFSRPLLASSVGTIIIFTPLALMSGVTGAFFQALSVTVAVSLVLSFLVAWLFVPALENLMRRAPDAPRHEPAVPGPLARRYAAAMQAMLRVPLLVTIAIIAPLVALGWHASQQVGSGFMPGMDEGGFVLDYKADSGTSLTETDRRVREIEKILRETPEVDTWSRRTGLQLGGALTEANEGDFFVRLRGLPRRDLETVMDEVRKKVEARVPGLEVEMALLMEDLIGDLLGVPQPIEIKLYSDDPALLAELGPEIAGKLEAVPGVVDVVDGLLYAGNAIELHVDPEAAALAGFSVENATSAVADLVDGITAAAVLEGAKEVGIRVVLPHATTLTEDDLRALRVRAPGGQIVSLDRLVTLKRVTGQPQITHEDMSRMIAITARISGRDLGSTVADVQKVLADAHLGERGVIHRFGGLYAEQQDAFRALTTVILAAALLVFLLLLFLYERFGVALAALLNAILSVPAVFIGLWLTDTELNITALMGLTMIVGIATEVSIFYVSELYALAEKSSGAPLVEAGVTRTRPIAMMKATAILSLLPLAIGWGEGAAMLTPLAIAIISGLIVQLPLVIFLLPCLLKLLGGRSLRGISAAGPASTGPSNARPAPPA